MPLNEVYMLVDFIIVRKKVYGKYATSLKVKAEALVIYMLEKPLSQLDKKTW